MTASTGGFLVTTARPSSSITHSVRVSDTRVAVAKGNWVQVLEAQGESSLSLQLNGRVSVLLPLSLSPSPTPTRLFVATEKRQCCVLNISSSIHDDDDDADDHVVTWNHGLVERLGRPVEGGHLGTCSSSQNGSAATAVVALHVYQGILHFIHFNNNKKGGGTGVSSIPTVFTARIDELDVIAMEFVSPILPGSSSTSQPSPLILAVLYQDAKEHRYIRIYKVNPADKDIIAINAATAATASSTAAASSTKGGISSILLNSSSYNGGGSNAGAIKVSDSSSIIIPVHPGIGGFIVLAEDSITYMSHIGSHQISQTMTSTNSTIFKCFSTIDAEGYRYLLGDYAGSLYTLHLLLNRAGNQVDFVKLESVGTGGNYSNMTIPQTLTHLTPSLVFVGSHFGDSLMLQFKSEEVEDDDRQKRKRRKDDDEDYAMALDNEGEDIAVTSSATTTNQGGGPFNVVATYPGLSPILDFCVVDLENRGQDQIVACCGGYKDASIRVIRNGIGIDLVTETEAEGLCGMWSLRPSYNTSILTYDTVLVLAFLNETKILACDEDTGELGEMDLDDGNRGVIGFAVDETSLLCANVFWDMVIQITPTRVLLLKCDTFAQIDTWSPDTIADTASRRIVHASANGRQIALALSGGWVIYLEIGQEGTLSCTMAKKMDHEISCINIHPLKSSSEEEVESSSQFIALGLWTDMSIRLLQLPTLTQVQSHVIGGGDGTIPRSVLMISFDEDGGGGGNNTCMHYLMAALGDGQLFTFRMDPTSSGALSDKRKIILGSRPISLGTFKSISSSSTTTTGGNVTAAAAKVVENVFVASDRPTVIHCSNQKLIYSNVNLKDVNHMCIFNTKAQPNSFALSTEGKLVIGSVNTIQKLDIKSFPLKDGDMGMRIAHSMDFRVFGILSTKIYVVGRYNDSSDGGNAGTASSRDKGKGRVVVEEMVIDGSSGSAAAVDEKMVGQECEESYFKIFNDQSFDEMDKWCMDKDENVQCIKAAFLATEEIPLPISNNEPTVGGGGNGGEVDDTDIVMDNQASTSSSSEGPHHSASSSSEQRLSPYFVVGTAYLDAMNEESTRGRILLFAVENGKISLVASLEVNGAVYDVAVVNGRIVAAINSKVGLYKFVKEHGPLKKPNISPICTYYGQVMALRLSASPHSGSYLIAVADLMKSVSFVEYKIQPNPKTKLMEEILEEVACDGSSNWMTSVCMLEDGRCLGSDNSYNLLALGRNMNPADLSTMSEEEKRTLRLEGYIHVGDGINQMKRGSLVMKMQDAEMVATPEVIFGTVGGMLGVIATMNAANTRLFLEVQERLRTIVPAVGNLSHQVWRSFENDRKKMPSFRFVDGDLIEEYLNLPQEKKELVVKDLYLEDLDQLANNVVQASNAPPAIKRTSIDVVTLVRMIEDITRIH